MFNVSVAEPWNNFGNYKRSGGRDVSLVFSAARLRLTDLKLFARTVF